VGHAERVFLSQLGYTNAVSTYDWFDLLKRYCAGSNGEWAFPVSEYIAISNGAVWRIPTEAATGFKEKSDWLVPDSHPFRLARGARLTGYG
jgi:hypothetical protein